MNEVVRIVLPPLLTVVLGGVVVQRYFIRRANEAAFVDHVVKELNEIRSIAIQYWSTSTNSENQAEQRELTIKLKAYTHSLICDLQLLEERATKKLAHRISGLLRAKKHQNKPIKEVMVLFDTCTGGDFESATHLANEGTILAACNSVAKLKSLLMGRKI